MKIRCSNIVVFTAFQPNPLKISKSTLIFFDDFNSAFIYSLKN